ncbi:hypothetical protein ACIP27_02765, partial [Streptomyces hydrogenans]
LLGELPYLPEPTPAVWRDLRALPQIERMTFGAEALADCPEDVVLPRVSFLVCYGGGRRRRGHSLDDVVRVFPGLQLLYLSGGTFDVSRAGDLAALRVVRTSSVVLTGTEGLPSRVRFSA